MIVPKVYEPRTNTLQDSNKERGRGARALLPWALRLGAVCVVLPPREDLKLSPPGVAEKRADIAASGEIYTTHPFHPSFCIRL